MIFDPDDFRDDPYQAGLNQLGHVVFGAALMTAIGSVWVVGGGILAWELWQLKKRGADKRDYGADLFFWWSGVAMWDSDILAIWAIVAGGAWMLWTWGKK